jgi:uncharacterized membrane protein YfcA
MQGGLQAGMDGGFLLLAGIVFFSYTTQAITGFGSTVVALALGAQIYSIPELLPVLVALNIPLCLYFVLRHRDKIQKALLMREILPWMSVGVAGGALLLITLPVPALKPGLGILIVFFSLREGLRLLLKRDAAAMEPAMFRLWTTAAGVTHGLYASGGPLLVYAVSRKNLDTSAFRATMMSVWLFFNFFLLALYFYDGKWTAQTERAVMFLLPLIPAGIYAGEILHHRIPVRGFWILVQLVLFVSGVSFLIR